MSSANYCFLTWIQVSQESGKVVWYFDLFENFPQFIVIHTVKGFVIVDKAEIDALENFTVATGLGKVSFHSHPKEGQSQRMLKLLHNCTHFTYYQGNVQNPPS